MLLYVLPFVLYFIIDKFSKKAANVFTSFFFIISILVFVFFELLTPTFIYQYDTRPNCLFLDYLIYPQEVIGTLFKNYFLEIVLTFIGLIVSVIIFLKSKKQLFCTDVKLSSLQKLIVFILGGLLLFTGARSSLISKRPINASNSIFSTDQMVNSLGINSTYSVLFAAYALKNEKKGTEL